MRKFNTLTGFLLSKTSDPAKDPLVEFQGYSSIGDGGAAQWQFTGITGQTPSQSPAQLGDAKLTDADGNQWGLIHKGTIFLEKLGAAASLPDSLPIVTAAIQAVFTFGGGDVVATEIYNMENRAVLKDNVVIRAIKGTVAGFKATASNPSSNGKLFGAIAGVKGWALLDLVLDGNSTNNTALTPLIQCFKSTNWEVTGCDIRDSAGIAVNISTENQNVKITNNTFTNIGFSSGVGGEFAKQAVAFSVGGHTNVDVINNDFASVGLDCISIGGITKGSITGNTHIDDSCYTLIYNDSASTELTITGNIAKTAVNEPTFGRIEGLGIDLPNLSNSSVSDNICTECSSAGLGIFSQSGITVIANNVIKDCNQSGAAIHNAGMVVRLTTGNVLLEGNISINSSGVTQLNGLLYDYNQRGSIKIGRANTFSGSAAGIRASTFASNTDIGTEIYSYELPEDLDGVGSPEGVFTAPKGSSYRDAAGGVGVTYYIKESGTGSTGWVAK